MKELYINHLSYSRTNVLLNFSYLPCIQLKNEISTQKECEACGCHNGGCIVWYTLTSVLDEYLAVRYKSVLIQCLTTLNLEAAASLQVSENFC